MSDPSTCRKAATLIRHALARTRLDGGPASEPYETLLREARSDQSLSNALAETAAGMGLRIVYVSLTSGLVLANQGDAPFAMRLSDLADKRQGQTGNIESYESRIMAGLALCAIVAAAFPGRGELTGRSEMSPFTVADVLKGLRDAEALVDRPGDGNADVETCASVLRRFIDSKPDAKRSSPHTRDGSVRKVLTQLTSSRFVTPMPGGSGIEPSYRATDAFRHLALDAIRHPLLASVLDVARSPGPSPAQEA